ncbi:MAG TPA: hypothetical protein VGO39_06615 [Gaiellaceae bacterium]|nr:hypothetical protein [Gaiellaceae bacterium]
MEDVPEPVDKNQPTGDGKSKPGVAPAPTGEEQSGDGNPGSIASTPFVAAQARSGPSAEDRFRQWEHKDPFPEIRPALLNSADIIDYVDAVGIVDPFYVDDVKSASYPIRLLGDAIYWLGNEKQVVTIEYGKPFTLKRNSIAFVTLEPMFRFPDYIAARFNLKIPNVYRGLLLGTGPLVDPGWTGQLSIPLHNLTTNDYVLKGGDELIWMEFTKISDNAAYTDRAVVGTPRTGAYRPFPPEKRGGDVENRVAMSAKNMAVSSSLASVVDAVETASAAAHQAQRESTSLARRYTAGGVIAGIVGLGTIVALAYQVWTVKQTTAPAQTPRTVIVRTLAQPAPATLNARIARLQRELRRVERVNGLKR